jgi:hypothetical protein
MVDIFLSLVPAEADHSMHDITFDALHNAVCGHLDLLPLARLWGLECSRFGT